MGAFSLLVVINLLNRFGMSDISLKPISSFLQPLRSKAIENEQVTEFVQLYQPLIYEHDYFDPLLPVSIKPSVEHSYATNTDDTSSRKELAISNHLKRLKPIQVLPPNCYLVETIKTGNVRKQKQNPKLSDVYSFDPRSNLARRYQYAEVGVEKLLRSRLRMQLTQSEFCHYLLTNYDVRLQQHEISKLEKRQMSIVKIEHHLKEMKSFLSEMSDDELQSVEQKCSKNLRKNRTTFKSHQLELLNELFKVNSYPHRVELNFLSTFISINKEVLRDWFLTRRQKVEKHERSNLPKLSFDLWKAAVYKWHAKWNTKSVIIEGVLDGSI